MKNTTFQCFTCGSRTKLGGFNESDRYECYSCFKNRQRTAKRPAGRRGSPTLYMDRNRLSDEQRTTLAEDQLLARLRFSLRS